MGGLAAACCKGFVGNILASDPKRVPYGTRFD